MQDDSVRRLINQLHANNGKMLSVCHTQINLTDADAVSHRIYHMAPHCVIAWALFTQPVTITMTMTVTDTVTVTDTRQHTHNTCGNKFIN